MKIRTAMSRGLLVFGVLAALPLMTGCESPEQLCRSAPAPTPQDLAVSNNGREVSITVDGQYSDPECELENGSWVVDN